MPSMERECHRIVIAGASSLLGAELKSLLEESKFAGWDSRLLDEEDAAGTLIEAGGEPVIIQQVEEGSFDKARFIFFTGSPSFTKTNLAAAKRSSGKIVDLSGSAVCEGEATIWFPKIDELRQADFPSSATAYAVPSAAGTAAIALTLALLRCGVKRIAFQGFQPVSEAGRAGIEELESQTGQLLSFQSVGQPIFDAQVAFNMLDAYGAASAHKLDAVCERVRAEVKACLGKSPVLPSIQVIHAPVFYGTMFSACAELDTAADTAKIGKTCAHAGFALTARGEAAPSNVSAAGEKAIQLAQPKADPLHPGTWWFWGAADNIGLPAANAVKLAEKLA
jgi:aspartate-semialdehyde dehydrogenase